MHMGLVPEPSGGGHKVARHKALWHKVGSDMKSFLENEERSTVTFYCFLQQS